MYRRLLFSGRQLGKIRTQQSGVVLTPSSLITECRSQAMSTAAANKMEVIHDTAANEFRITLKNDDGTMAQSAVLQYYEIKPGYVDLEHTIVPEEFQGHGIGKQLAQAAFDYFVEKKVDMRPTCTYLQKFYKDNPLPQYQERVKWDSSL